MMKLELNEQELAELESALSREISELGDEIAHTDAHEFKERLKLRRKLLSEILAKLKGSAVEA